MVNISAVFKTISIFFDYILVRKGLANQEIHTGFDNRWYGIYPRMTDNTNCRRVYDDCQSNDEGDDDNNNNNNNK